MNSEAQKKAMRNYMRKKKYGITSAEFETLIAKQGNVCGICEQPEITTREATVRALTVHVKNKVKTLLCHKCNMALGHMNNDSTLLRKAADYLDNI